jgi:hypothetical protein
MEADESHRLMQARVHTVSAEGRWCVLRVPLSFSCEAAITCACSSIIEAIRWCLFGTSDVEVRNILYERDRVETFFIVAFCDCGWPTT